MNEYNNIHKAIYETDNTRIYSEIKDVCSDLLIRNRNDTDRIDKLLESCIEYLNLAEKRLSEILTKPYVVYSEEIHCLASLSMEKLAYYEAINDLKQSKLTNWQPLTDEIWLSW